MDIHWAYFEPVKPWDVYKNDWASNMASSKLISLDIHLNR